MLDLRHWVHNEEANEGLPIRRRNIEGTGPRGESAGGAHPFLGQAGRGSTLGPAGIGGRARKTRQMAPVGLPSAGADSGGRDHPEGHSRRVVFDHSQAHDQQAPGGVHSGGVSARSRGLRLARSAGQQQVHGRQPQPQLGGVPGMFSFSGGLAGTTQGKLMFVWCVGLGATRTHASADEALMLSLHDADELLPVTVHVEASGASVRQEQGFGQGSMPSKDANDEMTAPLGNDDADSDNSGEAKSEDAGDNADGNDTADGDEEKQSEPASSAQEETDKEESR